MIKMLFINPESIVFQMVNNFTQIYSKLFSVKFGPIWGWTSVDFSFLFVVFIPNKNTYFKFLQNIVYLYCIIITL